MAGQVSGPDPISKSVSIDLPVLNDEATLFFTRRQIVLKRMAAILRGSAVPTVTWTVRYGTDRGAVGTEVVTGGTTTTSITTADEVTTFNNGIIPADNFVWLELTAAGGTLLEFGLTVEE